MMQTKLAKITRRRWILEEIPNDTGEPGIIAFALVIEDAHLPHFRYKDARQLGEWLMSSARGEDGGCLKFNGEIIEVWPTVDGVSVQSNGKWYFSQAEAIQLADDLLSNLRRAS
jgi:hypothetical protein